MSYKISIASGKGGTGKTTVSVSLYHWLSSLLNKHVQIVDCDVEEPNDILFYSDGRKVSEEVIYQKVPQIDTSRCSFCRECSDVCEYNAIVVIPSVEFAEVNSSLCHSCGACSVFCKQDAIVEKPNAIGSVRRYQVGEGKGLLEGRLKVGSAMQAMLIKELKKRVSEEVDIVLYDAPPGTSCSVVETVIDSDFVILVTEPTPFGLHDLKLTVSLMGKLKKSFGVVVNKAGLGSNDVYDYLKENDIQLLGEIPFFQRFASEYAQGKIVASEVPTEIKNGFKAIVQSIESKIFTYERNNCS